MPTEIYSTLLSKPVDGSFIVMGQHSASKFFFCFVKLLKACHDIARKFVHCSAFNWRKDRKSVEVFGSAWQHLLGFKRPFLLPTVVIKVVECIGESMLSVEI
jgi:hypothetical protein